MTTTRPRFAAWSLVAAIAVASTLLSATPAAAEPASITGHVDLGTPGVSAGEGEVRVQASLSRSMINPLTTFTDASGHYAVPGATTTNRYYVMFEYLGDQPLASTTQVYGTRGGEVLDHVIPPGYIVSGHVGLHEAGTPAAGVTVELRPNDGSVGFATHRTTTGSDGSYAFPRVEAVDMILAFSFVPGQLQPPIDWYFDTDGIGSSRPGPGRIIHPTADRTDYDVVLRGGAGITGIITDSSGEPIANMPANAACILPDYSAGPRYTAHSDEDGRYIFRGIPKVCRMSVAVGGYGGPNGRWPSYVDMSGNVIVEGVDIVVYEQTSFTVAFDGPGSAASYDDVYGQLQVAYSAWDEDAEEWSEWSTIHRAGAGLWNMPDLRPGYYYIDIYRFQNPYFPGVEALVYLEEGDTPRYEVWMPNPMSVQLLTFADVDPSNGFYEEIEWLYRAGITRGTVGTDGVRRFDPAQNVSRGAMAAFLYRAAGEPAFTPPATPSFIDVPKSYQFYKEIEWMKAQGIAMGTRAGAVTYYKPYDDVIRRDMAAFIYRAQGSPAFDAPTTPPFTDIPVWSTYAREIAWMKAEGITRGNADGSFAAEAPVYRAAMAAFLYRIYGD
ncbi:S-layer homology domain-containing protein [Protaetiibacter sp. SSC-01]|uniref:S-layer homology domain-containing protein n=1 Tax=Protaetiibacter sp. SSC-01 TaxID=2759943 RepID=UPI001656B209|nr:S-layer homology domain-containing protein [Protaetiibacter sp. SSC-01]QNO37055.1 S-layer homology domain-containing protein [Protaetiibacter sp. SSC-01]